MTASGYGPRGEKLQSTAEYLGLEGTLGTLAAYPAAVDYDFSEVDELVPAEVGGGGLPSDSSEVAAANAAVSNAAPEYTDAAIAEVIRQVNAGEVTVDQLETEYGVPAAIIQA